MHDITFFSHYCWILSELEICIEQSGHQEFIKAHASAMRIVEGIEQTLFERTET